MQLDNSQIEAIQRAVQSRVSVITGGAGTGKTTIIREIAAEIARRGESFTLAAFAGKAAARMREATGYEAGTIHRTLQYNGVGFNLKSLADTSMIIDEASMVSADLLHAVIVRNPKRLILVGDRSQLPPVGRGQPFHDLITLAPVLVSTLTTCYRNSEAIYQAAQDIRSGGVPWRSIKSANERYSCIRARSGYEAQKTIMAWVAAGKIDFDQDIILCPRNGESDADHGTVKSLNAEIKSIVNPNIPGRESAKFEVGDRVINGKNFPASDVWNGTTGRIHAIDSIGDMTVYTDTPVRDGTGYTQYVQFTRRDKMLQELELAYALTVHKSQGSQYRNVILVVLDRDVHCLLDRSMIYTAVTRAQKNCIVIGSDYAFRRGIANQNTKHTAMQEYAKTLEQEEIA